MAVAAQLGAGPLEKLPEAAPRSSSSNILFTTDALRHSYYCAVPRRRPDGCEAVLEAMTVRPAVAQAIPKCRSRFSDLR